MKNKTLHLVYGPTASGKTKLAIELALQHHTEIISADSRQVFQELRIGVARPNKGELAAVPHHLIAHTSIHKPYNAGIFCVESRHLVNQILTKSDAVIICGGSGLYIKALLEGLDQLPEANDALRLELQAELQSKGLESLQKRLEHIDPDRYQKTEILNPQRLMRAIEIAESPAATKTEIPAFAYEFKIEKHFLNPERKLLYQNINRRVDDMMEMHLKEEVESLLPYKHLKTLQTVGYSEWWPYFEGQISLTEVVDKIKQHTRNYAKRQVTWFKHQI